MSNILIYDVAAESGGALTVLNQCYEKAKVDSNNHYFFVISTPELEKTDNIKICRFPWTKKSWFHRLYMDKVYIRDIIKGYNICQILRDEE